MSTLREAAQDVVAEFDPILDTVAGVLIDRLRAALAQPETEAPVAIGPEWTPCVKMPVTVHVREQRPGEQHVSTREGITPVKPDDLIMRGVAGEEYPIGRKLFEKTYRIGDLARPEAESEPVAWQSRYIGRGEPFGAWITIEWPLEECANLTRGAVEHMRAQTDFEVRPLYAHPPSDEWREAVRDELVTTWALSAENKDDPRKALQDIINWHVRVSLDPAVSSDAQALIERGKAMRDEWRPASEPPEDFSTVIVWRANGTWNRSTYQDGLWCVLMLPPLEDVTHWRDVSPPTEG